MSEKLLDVKNLHTSFFTHLGEVQAIRDVSFGLDKGEIIGIVGESGSGKSVTSLSIMGLLAYPGRVKDGEILFNGEDLLKKKKSEMRKIQGDHIAMIFQDPMTSLNPLFKIGDQITEAILTHHKIKKEDAKKRALEMLRLVGIPSPEKRFHSYPHEFSGGMRQRAMIAMALSCEPELLIADEPTTALDVTIQAQIIALMEELQEKLGMSIIIITHDLGVVADMADEIIVMYAGEIVERGTARDIFYHQQHPYTWALLQSVPRIDDEDKTILNTIEGNIPDMIYPPKGCSFCTRCPYAMKICEEEKPKVTHITDEHSVACWLMDPRADRSGVPFGRTDA